MCENGVGYQVSFDPIRLSNLEHNRAGSVYAIAFAPKNEAVSALKYDQRIKDTIISSITAFILQNGVAWLLSVKMEITEKKPDINCLKNGLQNI